MTALLIAIAAVIVLFAASVFFGRRLVAKWARQFAQNGYFVGRSIDDAVAVIGPFSKRYPRWGERVDYVWGYGGPAVLLICDGQGTVVDYCPNRPDEDALFRYFEQNRNRLIGVPVWDIKKTIGDSHDYFSTDFGEACDTWKISPWRVAEVWSNSDTCTNVVFSNKTNRIA